MMKRSAKDRFLRIMHRAGYDNQRVKAVSSWPMDGEAMVNVEWKMLNVEWRTVEREWPGFHSTFNIRHSTFDIQHCLYDASQHRGDVPRVTTRSRTPLTTTH